MVNPITAFGINQGTNLELFSLFVPLQCSEMHAYVRALNSIDVGASSICNNHKKFASDN
jgi:hypothetical protein